MRIFNRNRQVNNTYSEPLGTRHPVGTRHDGNYPFTGIPVVRGQGRDKRTPEENELFKNEHPSFKLPTKDDWKGLILHGKEFEH